MKSAVLVIAATMLTGAVPAPTLNMPGWMTGDWERNQGASWTEEHWSEPRAGLMLGTGRSGLGETSEGFEYMRIERDPAGRLIFWGSPMGTTPIAFRLVKQTEAEIAFENGLHDYPTRVVYKRSGDMLTATISGPGGSKPQTWVFHKVIR